MVYHLESLLELFDSKSSPIGSLAFFRQVAICKKF